MLYTNTVKEGTLALLKQLQNEPFLPHFDLVGGTSLALRIGHRTSIDLDLFTRQAFSVTELQKALTEKYGFDTRFEAPDTLKGFIGEVFVDFIRYDYPSLEEAETIDGIRLASLPDVIAMKLAAITDNGTRMKDFIDIACLSTRYSLEEMLSFYTRRYSGVSPFSALKAITYFDEVDLTAPKMVGEGYSWEKITERLRAMSVEPHKIFAVLPKNR